MSAHCYRCKAAIEAPQFGFCTPCRADNDRRYEAALAKPPVEAEPYAPPKRRGIGGAGLSNKAFRAPEGENK